MHIRRLTADDVVEYRKIRLSALYTSPEAFGSTYETEAARPLSLHAERLTSINSIAFGAFEGDSIIGMVALRRETGLKDAHKGYVGGLYVEPRWRGHGVASGLMNELIEAAKAWNGLEQLKLAVVAGNEAALMVYERCGFERYGVEVKGLKWEGKYWDEILMVKFL